MRIYLSFILFFVILSLPAIAQQTYRIPAFTGYAVPAEKDGPGIFDLKKGVQNWKDLHQQLQYFVYIRKPGVLNIAIKTKNDVAGSVIAIRVAGKSFQIAIPVSPAFIKQNVGSIAVKDTGFYPIVISGIRKAGTTIADIEAIELGGSAAAGMHFNTKERRNAASVHLRYTVADTTKVIAFYNEIRVPENADVVHSYYMSNGFARGYFGIQVNSNQERRVIFSVWDAGNEAVSRSKVPDSNKVQLIAKGESVISDDFGNEGTGGHSHWVYPWKAGITYKLLVTALNDSASQTTIYTAYFFLPELQKWKLIASFKAPGDGKYLRNLYSFNENFVGTNGQQQRKAYYGNQWIQRENGSWQELTQSVFSYDATGKAGDRIDYGAGIENGQFYLWNGGFEPATAKYAQAFSRPEVNQKPSIDWTKNVDSAIQAKKDQQLILKAIQKKQIDTSGSKAGIYYQILKEGSGNFVALTDTVSVFYKGSLLKDGSVFDQTKDQPASFPLNRLIKGWQLGLPLCKTGGRIRLVIPSGLAYGIRARSKNIPPNSVLLFDIEVLKSKN